MFKCVAKQNNKKKRTPTRNVYKIFKVLTSQNPAIKGLSIEEVCLYCGFGAFNTIRGTRVKVLVTTSALACADRAHAALGALPSITDLSTLLQQQGTRFLYRSRWW